MPAIDPALDTNPFVMALIIAMPVTQIIGDNKYADEYNYTINQEYNYFSPGKDCLCLGQIGLNRTDHLSPPDPEKYLSQGT